MDAKYLWYIPGLVGVGIFLWKGLRHIQQQPLVGALYLSVVVVAVLMLARIL